MSYDSHVTGEIRIDPPLPLGRLDNRGFETADSRYAGTRSVRIVVEERPVPGVPDAYWRGVTGIVPLTSEPYSDGRIHGDVRLLAEIAGPGFIFSGWLECWGEEPGDIRRIYVDADGRAREVKATITWDMPERSGD